MTSASMQIRQRLADICKTQVIPLGEAPEVPEVMAPNEARPILIKFAVQHSLCTACYGARQETHPQDLETCRCVCPTCGGTGKDRK